MILTIADLLGPDDLSAVRDGLGTVRWRDGRHTAGTIAGAVKANRQADLSGRSGLAIRDRIAGALHAHPVLRAAAQPARFSDMIISRTAAGGGYGRHIDNPFMGSSGVNAALRTDLSYTLFLNDPSEYEGGALLIERPDGDRRYRFPAGTLLLYTSSYLHAVEPVARGERLVCVGWIESRVRDAERREILFDLENLAVSLGRTLDAQSEESLTLAKVIANLKRTFS
ncbi:MAG: Fe2+-dependent dioxygenase [Pseudomonadota bacterium]